MNILDLNFRFLDHRTETVQYPYSDLTETFDVSLIAANYCGSDTLTRMIAADIVISVEPTFTENAFLFPNPARSEGQVYFDDEHVQSYEVRHLDGRVILPRVPVTDKSIKLPSLPSGLFFIRIYDRQNLPRTIKLAVE